MTDNDTQNGTPEGQPQEKTAKQLKKEAEKAAKLEKLKAKLDKKSSAPAATKEKPEVLFQNCIFMSNYQAFKLVSVAYHFCYYQ